MRAGECLITSFPIGCVAMPRRIGFSPYSSCPMHEHREHQRRNMIAPGILSNLVLG